MPGTRVPVIRQMWDANDALPYWAHARFSGNHLYDLASDPNEDENLAHTRREGDAAEALRAAMKEVDAPPEQFERLGLA